MLSFTIQLFPIDDKTIVVSNFCKYKKYLKINVLKLCYNLT